MWIFIVLIMILVICMMVDSSKMQTNNKPNMVNYPLHINDLEYFAGYSDIGYSKCYIQLYEDKLGLAMKNSVGQQRFISYDDIEDIAFVSETEIKKVPSVAKLVLLGVWGLLGEGKEKKVSADYMVINCKNELNVVLKAEDRAKVKWQIKGEIGKYRYKQNQGKS